MRPSPQRHPLAVLRTLIGLTQKEMAVLAACSTATIQAVELGKLKLSEKLGLEFALKTGVSYEWLMSGNPAKPITSKSGALYTRATFENFAAKQQSWRGKVENYNISLLYFKQCVMELARASLVAAAKDSSELFAYRLQNAIAPICAEFPGNENLIASWRKVEEEKHKLRKQRDAEDSAKYEPATNAALAKIQALYDKPTSGKLSEKEFNALVDRLRAPLVADHAAMMKRLATQYEPDRETLVAVISDFIAELVSGKLCQQEEIRAKRDAQETTRWQAKRKKNPTLPPIPPPLMPAEPKIVI